MRKISPLEAMLIELRLAAWRERLGWSLAALLALALVAAAVAQGENVGAHIWRPGWFCGETVKGAPGCVRDPASSPRSASEAPKP